MLLGRHHSSFHRVDLNEQQTCKYRERDQLNECKDYGLISCGMKTIRIRTNVQITTSKLTNFQFQPKQPPKLEEASPEGVNINL